MIELYKKINDRDSVIDILERNNNFDMNLYQRLKTSDQTYKRIIKNPHLFFHNTIKDDNLVDMKISLNRDIYVDSKNE